MLIGRERIGKKEEVLFCRCHLSIEDSPETLNDLFGSKAFFEFQHSQNGPSVERLIRTFELVCTELHTSPSSFAK